MHRNGGTSAKDVQFHSLSKKMSHMVEVWTSPAVRTHMQTLPPRYPPSLHHHLSDGHSTVETIQQTMEQTLKPVHHRVVLEGLTWVGTRICNCCFHEPVFTQPKGEHIAIKFQWFVEWPMSLLRWLSIPPCYHVSKCRRDNLCPTPPYKYDVAVMDANHNCVCVLCAVCVCVCRVGTGQNGTGGLQSPLPSPW